MWTSRMREFSPKSFAMNVLNGLAMGVVVALVPGALLNVPLKALASVWEGAAWLLQVTSLCSGMMGFAIGSLTANLFKFSPIQVASVGMATLIAGGVGKYSLETKAWSLVGTGDVITMGVTAAMAVWLILLIGEKVKSYTLLVIPLLTIIIAGGLGHLLLPYIMGLTRLMGDVVRWCVDFQPIIMCILIACIFSVLTTSPFTAVGIAVAIGLDGIASGAANLGCCAAGFGLCVAGWKVNSKGVCLAHWIGSPKISMPIMVSNPRTMIPVLCNAAILGILAALLHIEGSPFSAGFGFSGLIGPVAALDLSSDGWTGMNVILLFSLFSLVPTMLGVGFNYFFTHVWKILRPEDYKLELE